MPADKEIIFTPDRNLGSWAAQQAGRWVIVWQGYCPTHGLIQPEDILEGTGAASRGKSGGPPRVRADVRGSADAVESTSGMIRFCQEDDAKEYIIGTESGMIHRLRVDSRVRRFYPLNDSAVCPNMKMITLRQGHQGSATRGSSGHGARGHPS